MRNLIFLLAIFIVACQSPKKEKNDSADAAVAEFESQVEDYIAKFAYQDSYNYMVRYTNSDPATLNKWVIGQEPFLIKAGEDKIVRMNNDTYYKLGFVDLSKGPVTLKSTAQTNDRFTSFQLMDDHNTNYHNVIGPDGTYILYQGDAPEVEGAELIEVPTTISAIIVRVEVKDKNDPEDTKLAKAIFNGITIEGPEMDAFPEMDLFKDFDPKVIERGNAMLDSVFKAVPFRLTVSAPDQLGKEVPIINHAAGTKGGWGGPVTKHSSYETLNFDANGELMDGSKGNYSVTFEAPPVDAFWSITVYDASRGGFLHPNKDDRYHINNTTAKPNEDGTYTFVFKTSCDGSELNCLEVPATNFDVVPRYYLPAESIRNGEWELPGIQLMN